MDRYQYLWRRSHGTKNIVSIAESKFIKGGISNQRSQANGSTARILKRMSDEALAGWSGTVSPVPKLHKSVRNTRFVETYCGERTRNSKTWSWGQSYIYVASPPHSYVLDLAVRPRARVKHEVTWMPLQEKSAAGWLFCFTLYNFA